MRAGATARPCTDEADDDDDLLRGAIFFSPIFIGTTIGTIFLREAALLRDITGDADADGDADALDKLADFDAKGVPLADALFSFHASYFFLVFVAIFFIPFLNP
jgi:hypothetical protein